MDQPDKFFTTLAKGKALAANFRLAPLNPVAYLNFLVGALYGSANLKRRLN
ncbi:hypothetical protein MK904_04660 [Loigolactobacillus coryniformis]|jgi:hypothetical protein|nr:hypothetical protein [Loigolactobacillus coryniformis]KRK85294.1 hypothetical protein FC16_GL002309 [Loigolactobacillus coryniformis subsp. torquens DSM 20004 = KCTC 3535]MCL5458606.1 hypothetical protein [Loigolactobacillus coryniformis]MDC4185394.1 hypothetical protein [Loigolactobacillus coryniformis]